MTISNAILKPYLDTLQNEFEVFFQQMGFDSDPKMVELKIKIQRQLHAIAGIKAAVTLLENSHKTLAPFELHAAYKAVKCSHRSIKRTLERFKSNDQRIRKMQERRSHVAVFAA